MYLIKFFVRCCDYLLNNCCRPPSGRHIIESARRGKHIFCEKPIDFDVAKIRNALETVKKANVKLQVGFQRRFDQNFKKLKEMIKEGKIGQPHITKLHHVIPNLHPWITLRCRAEFSWI